MKDTDSKFFLKLTIGMLALFGLLFLGIAIYPGLRFRYYTWRFESTLDDAWSKKLVALGAGGRDAVREILTSRLAPPYAANTRPIPEGAVKVYFMPGDEVFVEHEKLGNNKEEVLLKYKDTEAGRRMEARLKDKPYLLATERSWTPFVFCADDSANGSMILEFYKLLLDGKPDFVNCYMMLEGTRGTGCVPLMMMFCLSPENEVFCGGKVYKCRCRYSLPQCDSYCIEGGGKYRDMNSGRFVPMVIKETEGDHTIIESSMSWIPVLVIEHDKFPEHLRMHTFDNDVIRFSIGPKATMADVLRAILLIEESGRFSYTFVD
jgi:hypothetical protein